MNQGVRNKVIVFGGDNYCTLGIARQLGKTGLDVLYLITGGKQSCATKSRYCKNVVFVNSTDDGIEFLRQHFRDESQKPIIIAAADLEAEALDQNRNELTQRYVVPGTTEQGLLTKVDDKNYMCEIAEQVGFNVPKSFRMTGDGDLDIDISFPCFVKPAKFTKGRKKEFKARKCIDRTQLESLLQNVRKDSVFIVQEYIHKENTFLIYGCRMWDGNIKIAGTLCGDRWLQEGSDESHGFIMKEVTDLIDMKCVDRMLSSIDYHGLFSFEFGKCNGKAYFFEVNLRNDGTSQDFYQLGANLPLAWIYSSAGEDYDQVPTEVQSEAWYMDEIYDYMNIGRGFVSKKQWKQDFNSARSFRYYDPEDLAPWRYIHHRRHLLRMRRAILEKYRPIIVKLMDMMHK